MLYGKMNKSMELDLSLDTDGHDPAHRRLIRGSSDDEPSIEKGDATDALPQGQRNKIVMPLPFVSRSCETCLKQRKGDYILLNLNAALQHARSHHCGVEVRFSCIKCCKIYKSKHSAQSHVPKCKGPSKEEDRTLVCGICKLAFKTKFGLSQHERHTHPMERNKAREMAATKKQSRGPSKGYGKVWSKEEVDTMIRLEKSLQGHPQVAKQMMEHLPGKTVKQIRDKRNNPSYRALVDLHTKTSGPKRTPEPPEIICSSSDSEPDIRAAKKRKYISETEDELFSDDGEVSQQPSRSYPVTKKPTPARDTAVRQLPGLLQPTGNGSPSSREEATYQKQGEGETPNPPSPIGARGNPGDEDKATPVAESGDTDNPGTTTLNEQQWRTDTIRQALAETRDSSNLSNRCRDLHTRLVSILTDISEYHELISQTLIDDVYAQVLTLIGSLPTKRANKEKRTKRPTNQAGRKRKRRRYEYARTQDLFQKNPNLLARYIREGVPWLEDEDSGSPKPEDVQSFYTALWGASPDVTIPFTIDGIGHNALDLGEVFQAITTREVNERLNRARKNTASGPDGIERKHINGPDIREILRILYNIILVSKIQPRAWNANRTILIPKQGKDRSRVENYRPLTIGSLICRTYWGIVDKKLRNVISFSPRQKGFVKVRLFQ